MASKMTGLTGQLPATLPPLHGGPRLQLNSLHALSPPVSLPVAPDDFNLASSSIIIGDTRKATEDAVSAVPLAKRRRITYFCEHCGTSYTEKRALARHRHTNVHRRNMGLPPAQKYACTICGRDFSRDHDRQRHENEKHRGLKRTTRIQKPHRSPAADSVVGCGLPSPQSSQSRSTYTAGSESPSGRNGVLSGTDLLTSPSSSAIAELPHGSALDSTAKQALREPENRQLDEQPQPSVTGQASWTGFGFPASDNLEQRSWLADIDEDDSEDDHDDEDDDNEDIDHSDDDDDEEEEENDDDHSINANPVDRDVKPQLPPGTECDSTPRGEDKMQDVEHDATGGTPLSDLSSRTGSSAADSGIDMSQDASSRETKIPTTVANDHRDRTGRDLIVEKEIAPKTSIPLEARATVIQRHGRAKMIPAARMVFCIFCNESFEDEPGRLFPHLRRHMDSLEFKLHCDVCKIGFARKEDLTRHQMTSDLLKHCGFNFGHREPCTGHHPPRLGPQPNLTDWDSFRMYVQLQDWEQLQLRAYIANIRDLAEARNARNSQAYSVEALLRSSRNSFSSFAWSVKTLGSAPCDEISGGQRDIGGLQQRMKMMSIRGRSSQVRHTARKLPLLLRTGGISKGLHNAASTGDLQQIEALVGLGADVGALVNEQTILSAAAEHSRPEIVELLVKLGAKVDAADGKYGCALSAAASAGKAENIELLLLLGAPVNQPSQRFGSPLSVAAAAGQTASMRLLLQRGADVNQDSGPEGCPLSSAIWNAKYEAANLLLDLGANINQQSGQHFNPLCAAIMKLAKGEGHVTFVTLLLDRGAELNPPTPTGNPLSTAAAHADALGMLDVIKLLLDRGAMPNGTDPSALSLVHKRRRYCAEKRALTMMFSEGWDERSRRCGQAAELLLAAGAEETEGWATRSQSLSSASHSMTSSTRRPSSKDSRH